VLRRDVDEQAAILLFGAFLCCKREIKRGVRDEEGTAQRHRGRGPTLLQVRSVVVVFIDSLLGLGDDDCSGKMELQQQWLSYL